MVCVRGTRYRTFLGFGLDPQAESIAKTPGKRVVARADGDRTREGVRLAESAPAHGRSSRNWGSGCLSCFAG